MDDDIDTRTPAEKAQLLDWAEEHMRRESFEFYPGCLSFLSLYSPHTHTQIYVQCSTSGLVADNAMLEHQLYDSRAKIPKFYLSTRLTLLPIAVPQDRRSDKRDVTVQ